MAEDDRARWDARWAEHGAFAAPSSFLLSLDDLLPRTGTALDVAGGAGRNAVWLARRGLAVTVVDVSPVALRRAAETAAAVEVSLNLVEADLDEALLPAGRFDLVVSIDFLSRPLLARFADVLSPGGILVYLQATRRNLERNAHPSARFLLVEGELPPLVRGLDILRYAEDWFEGRHEARLVARKAI